ncbi:AraC family transcriptional regulator [Microvirga terrae]|uniref:AraC family transcriptional regulator n=2 Tax=Microvirga TaxID=186650 RepID=A0ABY5RPI3_9HYPH|nr:AraC family transcriptional regulator [Microvirga terrae]UVF19150.1 AraC family transcriptional regulator [Microvirga terrae]
MFDFRSNLLKSYLMSHGNYLAEIGKAQALSEKRSYRNLSLEMAGLSCADRPRRPRGMAIETGRIMADAHRTMEQTTPPRAGNGSGAKPAAQDGSVLDLVLRSTRLDEMEELTSTLISPNRLRPLTKDRAFESVFQIHGLQDFCTFSQGYRCSVDVDIKTETTDERMVFLLPSKGQGRLVVDRREFEVSDQHGVVFAAGPPRTLRYLDDCLMSILLMSRRKAAEQCTKLLGRDLDRDLKFDTSFDLSSPNGQSWVRLFQYATAELASLHSLFRSVAAARQQLEQTVLTGFLLSQTHTYSDALLRPQSSAAPFYVKRAEAYIEAHFSEPLSLADIAAQAGVSARSLQNGFQSFRGMTPMAFLRSLRLRRAQEALLLADPACATVTEIALSCGFNHMGEFASLYRRTFGVSPRQTLSKTIYR